MKSVIKKIAKPAMEAVYKLLMKRGQRHAGRKPFDESELKLVREALVSQNLFALDGYMTASFEREFAEAYGVPYAVASTSGTAAIHTALGALDLDAGDEVITAPVTDLGTIIPIINLNLIPVFADIDQTFCMDPEDVERKITSRTRAILVVHLFGNTCDMDRMMAVAKKHNLPVIEDCSQTHLTQYKGRMAGTIGDIGCFSFQQSKHMTTGDGGMTITSNKAFYDRMKLFVDKGYARKGWGSRAYLFHAPNYRMNELTAAVGRAQLKKVQGVIETRRTMGAEMKKRLDGLGIRSVAVTDGAQCSYWLYPFWYDGANIEAFCKAMIARGVYAMAGYTGKPIYLCTESLTAKKTYGKSELPFSWRKDKTFEYKDGLCPKAENDLKKLVCMPWHEGWGLAGVEKAEKAVREALEEVSGTASLRGASPADAGQATKQSLSTREIASVTSSPRNDSGKLRVGLIGCGQIGRWHLDAYKQSKTAQVVACVDTDLNRAKAFAQEIGAQAYANHRDMLAQGKVDAVSLCTVPSTHASITTDLLNAGVHVLCEKPLAMTVEEGERMTALAQQKNLRLLTAFKLRFSEEVEKAKELIDKGALGNILNFRILFGGYMDMAGTWHVKKELSGGGVIMDNGPHALDLVQYLFGEIEQISAQSWDSQSVGVEDTAKVGIRTKSGVIGTADLSWPVWVTPNAYLEIYGDEGTVLLDTEGVTCKFKTWADWKRLPNKTGPAGGFARQIEHFVQAVQTGKTPTIDGRAGVQAQKAIQAAYDSAQKNTPILIQGDR